MTNWEIKAERAEKVCRAMAPKLKELKSELRVYELIFAFYAKMKFEAQRRIVPIKKLSPSATNNRPERIASNIVAKAKALPPDLRKELIKALEGEINANS